LYEWLVIVPDNTEPHVLSKRVEVRPEHLTAAKDLVAANKLFFGGAFFDEPPAAGEAPKVRCHSSLHPLRPKASRERFRFLFSRPHKVVMLTIWCFI
jgi:hypothetical protein